MEATTTNSPSYVHKKFTAHKRKRDADQSLEENSSAEAPSCKRLQTKGFFRPWLDNEQEHESSGKACDQKQHQATPVLAGTYHANMVRHSQTSRQRNPKEQRRRDRNTLACLLSRRAKQAQDAHLAQQYELYRAQQAAILEQQVRYSLYYRQLLQQAVFLPGAPATSCPLPEKQQQFLQEMSLSQQMLIFGGRL